MSAIKKGHSESPDLINSRIQRKFDQVFFEVKKKSVEATGSLSFSAAMDSSDDSEAIERSSSAVKREVVEQPVIDLDFSIEDELSDKALELPEVKSNTEPSISMSESSAPKAIHSDDSGLDFSLDFEAVDELVPEKMPSTQQFQTNTENAGMDLNFSSDDSGGMVLEDLQNDFNENTQKTIVINSDKQSRVDMETFSLETDLVTPEHTTSDHMTTEEAKANIESTIIGIISPKASSESTQEIDFSKLANQDRTPSDNFSLDKLMEENDADIFSINVGAKTQQAENGATGEFFIDPADIADNSEEILKKPVVDENFISSTARAEIPNALDYGRIEKMNDEDSIRFHATIRQLREEREELLGQIKHLKTEQKELEQDNLSLKAGLDEAKIEISILRKRHMVELEDIKYRLTLSEEKKALSEEKTRQAELRREKLEQKVRIDYNQVKLREKELESKLEMLSMDIDSQVHSRDHKILELRRKIDALEFNMENASIKEQRSNEDRRKLEDKLNKIMKTLRNSIKNLEEDIDLVQEDLVGTEKN